MRWLLPSFLFVFLISTSAWAESSGCAQDKRLVDVCFSVQGRLGIYANLRPRLKPDNSEELLAIAPKSGLETGEEDYYWPRSIEKTLSPDKDISAKFNVCPFTKAEPGKLQYVCIDSISDTKVLPAKDTSVK